MLSQSMSSSWLPFFSKTLWHQANGTHPDVNVAPVVDIYITSDFLPCRDGDNLVYMVSAELRNPDGYAPIHAWFMVPSFSPELGWENYFPLLIPRAPPIFPLGVYCVYEKSVNCDGTSFVCTLGDVSGEHYSVSNTTGNTQADQHAELSSDTSSTQYSLRSSPSSSTSVSASLGYNNNCTFGNCSSDPPELSKPSPVPVTPSITNIDRLNPVVHQTQVDNMPASMPAFNPGRKTAVDVSPVPAPIHVIKSTKTWAGISTPPPLGKDTHFKIDMRAQAVDPEPPAKVLQPLDVGPNIPFERRPNGNQQRKAKRQPRAVTGQHKDAPVTHTEWSKASLKGTDRPQQDACTVDAQPSPAADKISEEAKNVDGSGNILSVSKPHAPFEIDQGSPIVRLPFTNSSESSPTFEPAEEGQLSVHGNNTISLESPSATVNEEVSQPSLQEDVVVHPPECEPVKEKSKKQIKRDRQRQNKAAKKVMEQEKEKEEEAALLWAKKVREQEEVGALALAKAFAEAEAASRGSSLFQNSEEPKLEDLQQKTQRKKGSAINKSGKLAEVISKNALLAKFNPSALPPKPKKQAPPKEHDGSVPARAEVSDNTPAASSSPPSSATFNFSPSTSLKEMNCNDLPEKQTTPFHFKSPLGQARTQVCEQTKPFALPSLSSFQPSWNSTPALFNFNTPPAQKSEANQQIPLPAKPINPTTPVSAADKSYGAKTSNNTNATKDASAAQPGSKGIFSSPPQPMPSLNFGPHGGFFAVLDQPNGPTVTCPKQGRGLFSFPPKLNGPGFTFKNHGLVSGPAESKAVLLPDKSSDASRKAIPSELPLSDIKLEHLKTERLASSSSTPETGTTTIEKRKGDLTSAGVPRPSSGSCSAPFSRQQYHENMFWKRSIVSNPKAWKPVVTKVTGSAATSCGPCEKVEALLRHESSDMALLGCSPCEIALEQNTSEEPKLCVRAPYLTVTNLAGLLNNAATPAVSRCMLSCGPTHLSPYFQYRVDMIWKCSGVLNPTEWELLAFKVVGDAMAFYGPYELVVADICHKQSGLVLELDCDVPVYNAPTPSDLLGRWVIVETDENGEEIIQNDDFPSEAEDDQSTAQLGKTASGIAEVDSADNISRSTRDTHTLDNLTHACTKPEVLEPTSVVSNLVPIHGRIRDGAYSHFRQPFHVANEPSFLSAEQIDKLYPSCAARACLFGDLHDIGTVAVPTVEAVTEYNGDGEPVDFDTADIVNDFSTSKPAQIVALALKTTQKHALSMHSEFDVYRPSVDQKIICYDASRYEYSEGELLLDPTLPQNRPSYITHDSETPMPLSQEGISTIHLSRGMTGNLSLGSLKESTSASPDVIETSELEITEQVRKALRAAPNAPMAVSHTYRFSNITSETASVADGLQSRASETSFDTTDGDIATPGTCDGSKLDPLQISSKDTVPQAGQVINIAESQPVLPSTSTSPWAMILTIASKALERATHVFYKAPPIPLDNEDADEVDPSQYYLGPSKMWAQEQGIKVAKKAAIITMIPIDLTIQVGILPPVKAMKTSFLVGRWACARFGPRYLARLVGA